MLADLDLSAWGGTTEGDLEGRRNINPALMLYTKMHIAFACKFTWHKHMLFKHTSVWREKWALGIVEEGRNYGLKKLGGSSYWPSLRK